MFRVNLLILLALSTIVFIPSALANVSGTCDVAEVLDCDMNQADSTKGNWTFGVGIGLVAGVPDYIGSNESKNFLLPLPYIRYDGPKLKIGQGGITAKLFNSDKVYLSISLSGAIPVDSDSNEARAGMADIEAVFEVGPSLKYYFFGNERTPDAVFLDINFRSVNTISFDSLDVNSTPKLVMRKSMPKLLLGGHLSVFGQAQLELVSDAYASYFYGVEQQDSTAQRPLFNAKGGYAGYRASSGLRWQQGNQIVSFYFGFADISDAKYANSPLVTKRQNVYGGGTYFWLF